MGETTSSKEKHDEDRYAPMKGDWSAESRISSHRSPGLLSSGSLRASFSKRRVIGRNEPVEDEPVGNGMYRSAVCPTESFSSPLSPPHAGKAEKDACSPGYGSSPNVETPSKSLDGHHHRDGCLSPASAGPLLSSPRTDFAVIGNQHEPEVSGVVDREKSRFSSSPHGWELSNRGLDNRNRAWSRYGFKRPYPLPKLDSSKDWSWSDRELLGGRIDRYSGVSGREVGFSDVVSGHGRESTRNDCRGRERALQSGVLSYSPANSFYSRDSKSFSFGSDAAGSGSPLQHHSPLQSSFSYDSDVDTSLISSRKRPRLTWGQGLAKYEKERTGDKISAAKKSEEGSNFAGGLHADGPFPSTLPEFTLQPSNAIFWSEDGHRHQGHLRKSDVCLGDVMVLNSTGQSIGAEDALIGTPELSCPLLQYMLSFIDRYKQAQSSLSEDVLTQHVEKVELEVDRLEKELIKLEKKFQELDNSPETNLGATVKSSEHVLLEPSNSGIKESPGRSLNLLMDITSVDAGGKEELGLVTSARHAVQGVHDPFAKEVHQGAAANECMNGGDLLATPKDIPASITDTRTDTTSPGEFQLKENVKDFVASLLLSNQEIAKESMAALAHLSHRVDMAPTRKVLTRNIQDTICWKQNLVRHKVNQKILQSRISEERSFKSFTEGVLAIRYGAKRGSRKQDQVSSMSSIDNELFGGNLESEQKEDATPSHQSLMRVCSSSGLCVADARIEEMQVVKKLTVERSFHAAREYVKMPMIATGWKARALHRFESKNGLIDNPVAAELERKTMNPWSPEEKRIFVEKYSLLGKNLRKIATYLEHKTMADCVQFYYQNQKTEEFEKIRRRHQLKKRRESRSSAYNVASATLLAKGQCEANTAYAEGLSLVAAAAAAMSVPRSVRSLALKTCLSGSTSCDLNVGRQTASSSGKNSSLEKTCDRPLPATPSSRGLKKRSDGVVQWRSQWNDTERELFMKGVALYGKDLTRISKYMGSKSMGQCKAFFNKARKQLGLDQLLERRREFPLDARQQEDNMANIAKSESHTEVDADRKGGGCVSEQMMSERSTWTDRFLMPEIMRGESFCGDPALRAVGGISTPLPSQAVNNVGSFGLCQNPGLLNVDIPVNNGECATGSCADANAESSFMVRKLRDGPSDAMQGHTDSPVCVASLPSKVLLRIPKSKTAMALSSATGASHSISSYGPRSPTRFSALAPPVDQFPQMKDRPAKTAEVKARREPTSWTPEEKEKFVDILKAHGKNWDLLCKNLPAKSLVQIKTYFQNSKAKLALESESVIINSGRCGLSWKRKMDDMNSSDNAGPRFQISSQNGHAISEEGNLTVFPSLPATVRGSANNVPSAEAMACANIFGINFFKDSLNDRKVLHSVGLGSSVSNPGIVPLIAPPTSPRPTLLTTEQSYLPMVSSMKTSHSLCHKHHEQSLPSMMMIDLNSLTGMHQVHQLQPHQQVALTCQDLPVTEVLPGCNRQSSELEQPILVEQGQRPIQKWQQAAEVVRQELLPQAVQRHQKQLQLGGQQMPHHFQPVLSHQVQSNWSAQSEVGSTGGPSSIVSSQQIQQKVPAQPHLHHTHGNLLGVLQQHQQLPQLNELQIVQLQRQQEQQQLLHLQHQAQALSQPHQVQNHTILVQENQSFSNEQQQTVLLRGSAQISSAVGEGLKQNDVDFQSPAKSQQRAFGNVHQLLILNETSEVSTPPLADSEAKLPASDVKLFGQSLVPQLASGTAKFSSPSCTIGVTIAVPPSSMAGSGSGSCASNALWDCAIQGRGQGWQQGTLPGAQSNGDSSSEMENDTRSLRVQDCVSCSEKLHVAKGDKTDGGGFEGKVDLAFCRLPDGHPSSSATVSLDRGVTSNGPTFSCGSSNDSSNQSDTQKSGNLDHLISPSISSKQDRGLVTRGLDGDMTVSQGLPRVLDALVALAEWRLQNSEGCSGKLTDEFLSQSWEALQKNPGSLIEVGRAGGSLSQRYSKTPQMLEHLREGLLSSHTSGLGHTQSSAGSNASPGLENGGFSNDGRRLVSPDATTCVTEDLSQSDECAMVQMDGSGGAVS